MLVLPDTPTCQAHAHLRARVSTRPGGVQSANTRFSETTPVIMRENETTEITSPPPRYRLQGRQPITQSGTSPACPLIKGSDAGLKAPSTRRSATSWRGRQPITRSDTCLRAHVRTQRPRLHPLAIPPPRSDTGDRARQPITWSDTGPRARRLTTPPPPPSPRPRRSCLHPPVIGCRARQPITRSDNGPRAHVRPRRPHLHPPAIGCSLQGPSTDHSVRHRPSSPHKTTETTSPPPSYTPKIMVPSGTTHETTFRSKLFGTSSVPKFRSEQAFWYFLCSKIRIFTSSIIWVKGCVFEI